MNLAIDKHNCESPELLRSEPSSPVESEIALRDQQHDDGIGVASDLGVVHFCSLNLFISIAIPNWTLLTNKIYKKKIFKSQNC